MEPFIKFFRMPGGASHLYAHIKFSPDEMYYLYFMIDKKNHDWVKYSRDIDQIENHIPISYLNAQQWLAERGDYLTFLYSKIAEIFSKQKEAYEVRNHTYDRCFILPVTNTRYDNYGIYIGSHKIIDLNTMGDTSIRKISILKPVFAPAHMRDYDIHQQIQKYGIKKMKK